MFEAFPPVTIDNVMLVTCFAAFIGLLYSGISVLSQSVSVDQRLRRLSRKRQSAGAATARPLRRIQASVLIQRLGFGFKPSDADAAGLRLQLVRAGYRAPSAIAILYACRLALGLGLPTFAGGALLAFEDVPPLLLLSVVVSAAAIGLYGPFIWLSKRAAMRRAAIRESFPYALDLLLVCVHAGGSLPSALTRVADEILTAHPVLGEELEHVAREIDVGVPREGALRNFAERVSLQEISSLVTLLIQSTALGSPISDTLAVYTEELRRKQLLRAEERANKVSVKIVLPLTAAIFPSLMIVLLAPLAIRMVRYLDSSLGG